MHLHSSSVQASLSSGSSMLCGGSLVRAVAADLLGDAVLWFSIVPGGPDATIELPAVAELVSGGWVRLSNDWVLRHAPKVERSCSADTTSLTDFINTFGDRARSTFDYETQRIVKVTCPKDGS